MSDSMRSSLSFPSILRNKYYGSRHGHAQHNLEDLFVSNPKNGIGGYGLTRKGINQAYETSLEGLSKKTIIFSSHFLRAIQTATIFAERLGARRVYKKQSLQERFFGELEGTSMKAGLPIIRTKDQEDSDNKFMGIESPNEVAGRLLALMIGIEREFAGETILLVSHGDPMAILQAMFNQKPAGHHDLGPRFKNAEIRKFTLLQPEPLH